MSRGAEPPRKPDRDIIEQLDAALKEAGLTVSFSIHCRSGIVGNLCRCWRCRGEKKASDDESAAERDANLIDLAKVFYLPRSTP